MIAVPADPITLDPVAMQEVNSATIGNAIHASLVRLDTQGKVVPVLAESVEILPGAMTAVVKLRAGGQFWDGSAITVADVQASLERLQASTSPLKWVTDRISKFKKTGDLELEIQFGRPEPDFIKLIANLQAAIVKSGSDKLPKLPFDAHI
ncbi:MAG: hypothetical protein K8R87_12065, partial [Verrucomicrobia bacterium]|nr:hypothetical protein [Verrucomicrobiota bacterium]